MARSTMVTFMLQILLLGALSSMASATCNEVSSAAYVPYKDLPKTDKQNMAFPLNLEYLETEFFGFASVGHGLDKYKPYLAAGGPPPKGGQLANLDPVVRDIIKQFFLQEVGHVEAIKATVGEEAFPRPQLDLSKENFAKLMDKAVGHKLEPPFDPYANSVNYMLASYVIPYVGLTGYVGTNPMIESAGAKRLLGGLLGVESGQDAVIRTYLYERKDYKVEPYPYTVAEFTNLISILRNNLDSATGVSDEGLTVPKCLGAEGLVEGNILVGDQFSLSYARTAEQVLQVVYSTGNPSVPGGFFPDGALGTVAQSFLHKKKSPKVKNNKVAC